MLERIVEQFASRNGGTEEGGWIEEYIELKLRQKATGRSVKSPLIVNLSFTFCFKI